MQNSPPQPGPYPVPDGDDDGNSAAGEEDPGAALDLPPTPALPENPDDAAAVPKPVAPVPVPAG